MRKLMFIFVALLLSCSTNVTEFRKLKDSKEIFYSITDYFTLTMDSPKSFSAEENYYFKGNIYFKLHMDNGNNKCYYDLIELKVYDENHVPLKIERIDIVKDGSLVARNVNLSDAVNKYEFNEVYFVCESRIDNSFKIYIDYKIKISVILVQEEVFDYWDENVELTKYIIKCERNIFI